MRCYMALTISLPASLNSKRRTSACLKHADFIAIEGGDHYQFGSFDNMDVTATISRDEQQQQTVQALRTFLKRVPE